MSYYSHCLNTLGLTNATFTKITRDELKYIYKKAVLTHHPDKGGAQDDINAIKGAFIHLASIMDPGNKGRGWIQETIDDPDTLKGNREDIASLIDILTIAQIADEKEKRDKFNEEFEKSHVRADYENKGYNEWLSCDRPSDMYETPEIKRDVATNESNFNSMFEQVIKRGAHPQHTSQRFIDLMAIKKYCDNSEYTLTTINIPQTGVRCAPLEYTDIYSAFNEYNTITDKVTFDDMRLSEEKYERRLENYIKHREFTGVLSGTSYQQQEQQEQQHIDERIIGAFITEGEDDVKIAAKPIQGGFIRNIIVSENPEDSFIKSITSRGINELQTPSQISKSHCGVPSNTWMGV